MKFCEECFKEYEEKRYDQKYCSIKCANKHYTVNRKCSHKIYKIRQCEQCKSDYIPKRQNQRCCNPKCSSKFFNEKQIKRTYIKRELEYVKYSKLLLLRRLAILNEVIKEKEQKA